MSTGLFWYYARLYHESHVNFDDKDGNVFEQIKVREFNFEQKKERKLVCTTKNYFKTLSPAEKKAMVMISDASHIALRKVVGARFLYLNKFPIEEIKTS